VRTTRDDPRETSGEAGYEAPLGREGRHP
jgi:hypothetical protein